MPNQYRETITTANIASPENATYLFSAITDLPLNIKNVLQTKESFRPVLQAIQVAIAKLITRITTLAL